MLTLQTLRCALPGEMERTGSCGSCASADSFVSAVSEDRNSLDSSPRAVSEFRGSSSTSTSSSRSFGGEDDYHGVPDPSCWPDRPLYLRQEPGSGVRFASGCAPFRVGRAQNFETDIFKGTMVLRASDLPTSEEGQFGNRRRRLQFVVQGQFKSKIRYSDLSGGQQFGRPLTNAPSGIITSLLLSVVRRISPCYSLSGPKEARPGVSGLLLGLAQSVCVSEPGDEPDPMGIPYEDTALLGEDFPSGFAARKKFFSKRGGDWENEQFDTSKVWTFGFWQALMSMATFQLDLGVTTLSAAKYIHDQPLILCAEARGKTMYNVEIWNELFVRGQNDNKSAQ